MKLFTTIVLLLLFLFPFHRILTVEYVDGHDFLLHFHMIHILERYIKDGIMLPRWLNEATYGYGSPIFSFMWGVPYYLGAFLHILGLTYSDIFKVLLILPNLLSGIGLFLWLKPKSGKFSAFVASIVYIWVPYRFLDTFIRNAIGELFFFAFFPFILIFLDHPKSRLSIIGGMFFSALLIYSHQGLSLFGYPFLIAYILFQDFLYKRFYLLKKQLLILFGGLLLTFFYWFPVLNYQYLLPIAEGKAKSITFPPLFSLIHSKWEGGSVFDGKRLIMSFQIGLGQLMIILISHLFLFYLFIKRKKERVIFLFWLSVLWLSIFFLQPISKWFWIHVPLIINLQFPFRLLFFPMLVAAVLSSQILAQLKKNLRLLVGVTFVIAVIIANRNHLGVLNKDLDMNEFFSYQGTYDVGGEKLPKYVNLKEIEKEYEEKDTNEFIIVKGSGKITNQQREKFTSHANIIMETEGKIRIRRIYFPGWNVYLDGNIITDFQKGNGITVDLPKGNSSLIVEYKDPFLVRLSNFISAATLLFILTPFYNIKTAKRK